MKEQMTQITKFFAITNMEELDTAYDRYHTLLGSEYLSDSEQSELDAVMDEIKKYERTIGRLEE